MIVTNGDILHPVLFHQNNPHPLFDRCRQMVHPHRGKSLLYRLRYHVMAVATNEITPQLLGQALAEVEAVAAA